MINRKLQAVLTILAAMAIVLARAHAVEPSAQATAEFERYVADVEARLGVQHGSRALFVAAGQDTSAWNRLRRGELVIEDLAPAGSTGMDGALLHHWRGTAFVLGATASEFARTLQDFASYPQRFAPDVARVAIKRMRGNHDEIRMRLVQKRVLTVVLDADYDVTFGQLDPAHQYSISRSRSIEEIAAEGTRSEHALTLADSHGFLWRQNTYWTWKESNGGILIQIETVSLSRDIPYGLGWVLRPYIESVPRDSLTFTLNHAREAIKGPSAVVSSY